MWLCLLGMLLFPGSPLLAHSQLIAAEPAIGSTLDFYPSELRLTFDQPISPKSNVLLWADNFKMIELSHQQQMANELLATLPPLPQGVYTVQYDVISIDGDILLGSYEFAIAAPIRIMDMLTSPWLLVSYYLLFLIVAVGWRTYRVWRLTGVNALATYYTKGVHGLATNVFRAVFAGMALVLLINALVGSARRYLIPIEWLEHSLLHLFSWGLLLSAFVVVVVAQIQMGSAWRIGIDVGQNSSLIRHGIFRYSRNPIFLGIRLSFLSLFLLLPNAFTLLLWVLGDIMMQIQVRLEEDYLTETFGDAYMTYQQNVRRWI